MRQRAVIRFSDVALKAALKIRPDLDIVAVTFDPLTGATALFLRGEALPLCCEGSEVITVDIETVSQ